MTGVAYALHAFIPLCIHCDAKDIHVVPQVKSIFGEKPTFYIYDSYPGGIGLAERMFDLWNELVPRITDQVEACPCSNGCPACIGAQDAALNLKEEVIKLLYFLQVKKDVL